MNGDGTRQISELSFECVKSGKSGTHTGDEFSPT